MYNSGHVGRRTCLQEIIEDICVKLHLATIRKGVCKMQWGRARERAAQWGSDARLRCTSSSSSGVSVVGVCSICGGCGGGCTSSAEANPPGFNTGSLISPYNWLTNVSEGPLCTLNFRALAWGRVAVGGVCHCCCPGRLRVCARVGGCAATSGRRRGLGCGLLGTVVLLHVAA